jgi:spermidine synthase
MTPLHFGLCFLFAACNMLYYQIYHRLVASFTGDIVLWGSVGSAVYLCSLGIGILRSDRTTGESCVKAIGLIELLISLWAPLAFVLLYLWHILYRIYFYDFGQLPDEAWRRVGYFGIFSQLPLAYLGYLAGLESGFLSKLGRQHGLKRVQSLIALYYIGGLVGSFLLTLWLLPRLEPLAIILAFSLLNLAAAAIWLHLDPVSPRKLKLSLTAGGLAIWGLLLAFVHGYELSQTQAKNFYYNHYSWNMGSDGSMTFHFPRDPIDFWKLSAQLPSIERHYGPYQVIDFVPKPEVKVPEARPWMMTMDGRFQLSSVYERAYHETFAHVPSGLEGQLGPRILIVGGGDGLLARELLRYENELSAITLVDIDPKILQLSRQHPLLLGLNQGSLLHPKVDVQARDAFTFLRHSQGEFDRIYLDILYPYNFESSRLYSVEFLALARQHLAAHGQLVMLSPLDFDQEMNPERDRTSGTILSTIHEAGFAETILFAEERHSFLLARPQAGDMPEPEALRMSPYIGPIFASDALPRYRRLPYFKDLKLVNSVLKPTFMGQKDSFF